MLDVSRRNFLKGLMATAGVAAVGIPLSEPVAEVAVAPAALPGVELGDLWLKIDGAWRFIGKTIEWQFEDSRDVVPISLSLKPGLVGLRTFEFNFSLLWDVTGEVLIGDEFYRRNSLECLFGMSASHALHVPCMHMNSLRYEMPGYTDMPFVRIGLFGSGEYSIVGAGA